MRIELFDDIWETTPESGGGTEHVPAEESCITCSDDATACTVVRLSEQDTALVDTGQGLEEVDVSLVGTLCVGDTILVHAKTAISRLGHS
jgi:hydrogenase expression/formation protein HypC